jgi:hypothetical protein
MAFNTQNKFCIQIVCIQLFITSLHAQLYVQLQLFIVYKYNILFRAFTTLLFQPFPTKMPVIKCA